MADQFKKFNDMEFFLDMQRCIGCHSCEMACAECETNGETSMIHIHYVDRRETVQTTVQVCMHCDDPICANVCPADAIVKDEFGIVHSADVSNRVCELRTQLSVWGTSNPRPKCAFDDEVQYVLRSYQCRFKTYVCYCLPKWCAHFRYQRKRG